MKAWLVAVLLAAVCGLQAAPAAKGTWRGIVTHVTDGDSLWVRPVQGGTPLEIRLVDLDAPEGCQVFGPEAHRALRQRVLHQPVRVRPRGSDDYRRQLARIDHRGDDVNAWMVRRGYAWSSTFRGRRGPYARQEAQARAARAGLWGRPGPLEPRSFRKRFGPCH